MDERPEIFELGDADELTQWRPTGNWDDGVEPLLIWVPSFVDSLGEETEE